MNKSTETGLQDLLFNGAVACLLLFIIYAIKANGYAVISSLSSDGDTGKYQATASLPIETEKVEGEMISYRKVHIKGLTETLAEQVLSGVGWEWQTSGEIEESVELVDNGVILSVSFINHPNMLRLLLSIESSIEHNLYIDIIEGKCMMAARIDESAGNCFSAEGGVNINELELVFNVIEGCDEDNICKLISFK